MNWNELPADELLERIKSKSDSDREDILNDYIVENHDKLQPLKLLPLLDAIDQIKKSNLEKGNLTEEGTENCLNDRVFLSLWMAKIYLNELFDVNRSRELVDEAKDLIQRYEGKYVKEMRDTNEQTLMELSEKLKQISKEVASDKEGQMPKPFEDYLNLLEKKRVFKEQVNENVGHTRRYGYLFTGNSGTGKRSAAKQLFNVLKAIESETQIWVEIPAIQMFDPSSGFSPIGNTIEENRHSLIYISGAEDLGMKGLLSQTGIEILANKLKTEPTVTVVLSGPRDEMIQLINSCQAAKEIFINKFHFEDFDPKTLTDIAVNYAQEHGYRFSEGAQHELLNYFSYEHKMRGNDFGNIHLAHRTIDDKVLPSLIQRVVNGQAVQEDKDAAITITSDDIPKIRHRDPKKAIERLESLVGLENIKQSIMAHASLVNLNRRRMELGLFNHMPPMHMVFTGNPGTGKTTVAELIGEIYYGMGVLSSGHLVEVDRSKLVGQFLGDTEKNTLNAIKSAAGGVLFIDEAYNLFTNDPDRRDFGHRVIETLLTYLSMEQTNMIVVLAGYTVEMEHLLQSNPGLKSRFSYLFHFNDYTPEQLMKIGGFVMKKEQYKITPEAEKKLTQYVINAYNNKDEHFGNGRFITRLLTTKIIPSVSDRLYKMPAESVTAQDLVTITEADIPEVEDRMKMRTWDSAIIDDALEQLDELAGLENVKKALRDYVVMLHASFVNKTPMAGNYMTWNFLGNTGSGKSTVAEILCRIMQGASLLPTNHFCTLNIEEFANANNPMAIVEKALLKATDGMLFLDLDSPNYSNYNTDFLQFWIDNKRKELNMNIAVVIARTNDNRDAVVRNLMQHGVVPSNHILVFEDFQPDELKEIFSYLLKKQFNLDIEPEAKDVINRCIDQIYKNRQNYPVNARTIQLLASTVAQIAQLRIFNSSDASSNLVVKADTDQLEWSESSMLYRRIGF
ncbi:MAG: AAA family ATPase [Bacteroidales bacterium]|nr:AAA family ATPase [Bacteroidales bacterium]MBQ6101955.1 AAA family ATPase [Bacteroidales bacterium]